MVRSKEIRSLTGLRGLAALYVIVFHYIGEGLPDTPRVTILQHGYLAVDLFFILSGFVMALNYKAMFAPGWSVAAHVTFLGRRIARIYPLYVVCTLCALLLMVAGSSSQMPQCDHLGRALGLNLAMVQAWGMGGCGTLDGPAWSISTEWAAYLLFPALLVPTLLGSRAVAWITGCLSVAALGWLCLLSPAVRHSPMAFKLLDFTEFSHGLVLVRCVAEFMLGLLCFRVAGSRVGLAARKSGWLAPSIAWLLLVLLALRGTDLGIVLLCAALIVCLASEGGESNVAGRVLGSAPAELLGVLSYSLYLLHNLFGGLHYRLQVRFSAMGIAHAHVWASVIRAVVLPVTAYGVHRLIEVPGRQWLRNVFEPRRHVVVAEDAIATSGEKG
jgi:peptidoglycan/LPS O-acetylase OafA/YrhL